MNKPILAACAGVTFGLFLGGLLMGGFGDRSCHRRVEARPPVVHAQTATTRVVFHSTIIRQSNGMIHTETRQQVEEFDPPVLDPLTQAQTAFVHGNYHQSIALAKSAAKDSPVRANRIIGAAACVLGDVAQVEQSYRVLDVASRQYLIYVCQRSGVTLSGKHFRKSE